MDDNVHSRPFVSKYNVVGAKQVKRPLTKRLPVPGRKPGGPRHAFRSVQNNFQHVRKETIIEVDTSRLTDEVQPGNSGSGTTELDIDLSCLAELDDQLLASPIDSFMDVCWADAVDEQDPILGTGSRTLYNAVICAPQKVFDDYHDLDPLEPDSKKWYGGIDAPVTADVEYEPEPQKLQGTHSPSRSQPSLAFWVPHFTIPNPNDTVHGFPSRPPKSRRWRKFDLLANGCLHFPNRRVRSTT